MAPPLRVALTGGIASGKSYCLEEFRRLGAAVVDADVIAREVAARGTPGLAAVRQRFGPDVLTTDGELDRAALADVVFRDPEARRDLEQIIHPLVYDRISRWFESLSVPVGIAEIPLLYETGRQTDFDRVVVAVCPPEEQKRRAMARGGLNETDLDGRLAAQRPLAEKARLADFVIDTGRTPADTDRQVKDVWQELSGDAKHIGGFET